MSLVPFNKPPLTYLQQLEQLQERGLQIPNPEKAIHLLQTINPTSSFSTRFSNLLEKYPNVDTRAMGFPSNWKDENLWK